MEELPTRRLRALQKRITNLDDTFLPALNPTGIYTDRQYDRVRAFVVLTHAEIEAYIEGAASEILTAAEDTWRNKGRICRCIAALMMYGDRSISAPRNLSRQATRDSFEQYLFYLVKRHRKLLSRDNHGIREKNVLGIFLPLGVLEHQFDAVWLANMDSFGIQRGVVAHSSATTVQSPPDPKLMRAAVADIIQGLETLEPHLRTLGRS